MVFRALAIALTLVLVGGCASSGSSSTARSRTVSRGDTIEFRLPASVSSGSPEWRITKFDSRKVSLTGRTRVDATVDPPEWVFQLIARNAGTTEVEFTRSRVAPGAAGRAGIVSGFVYGFAKARSLSSPATNS